jgi:hypothetical protein
VHQQVRLLLGEPRSFESLGMIDAFDHLQLRKVIPAPNGAERMLESARRDTTFRQPSPSVAVP